MSAAPPDYAFDLRDRFDLSLERVGREGEPVLVVDGVLREPGRLVDYAATEVAFAPAFGPGGGYPGLRAPAPLNYVRKLVRTLSPSIERAFGLSGVRLARAECNFSMVTLAPAELVSLQRIPHVDTVDPLQFALLHYLCAPEQGGTAFYRHRATGYETITAERRARFEAARDREIAAQGPSGYIGGDTRDYEQIAAFDARFDRLLVYRSRLLHSGQVAPGGGFSADPRKGRLTANIFLNYAVA